MEFVGEAACGAVTETNPGEYTASCDNRAVGNHLVRAFIRDSGAEVDRDSNDDVFIGSPGVGDRWDAIGDSLTLGLYDNFASGGARQNPARQLERVHSLLNQARRLAREER